MTTIHNNIAHCSILRDMWAVSVDSVETCLEEAPLKKGTDSAKLHQRLFTTLKTMREFYHCGGDGLKDKELDSDLFMVMCTNFLTQNTIISCHSPDTLLQVGHPASANTWSYSSILHRSSATSASWSRQGNCSTGDTSCQCGLPQGGCCVGGGCDTRQRSPRTG